MNNLTLRLPFVSVWDGGIEVETTATVNIKTGEVTEISSVSVSGLKVCEEQYVIMNSARVFVYESERGYDYWADIRGEYKN